MVGGDLEMDDVHLLLEYTKGQTWGSYVSPRANRCVCARTVISVFTA